MSGRTREHSKRKRLVALSEQFVLICTGTEGGYGKRVHSLLVGERGIGLASYTRVDCIHGNDCIVDLSETACIHTVAMRADSMTGATPFSLEIDWKAEVSTL